MVMITVIVVVGWAGLGLAAPTAANGRRLTSPHRAGLGYGYRYCYLRRGLGWAERHLRPPTARGGHDMIGLGWAIINVVVTVVVIVGLGWAGLSATYGRRRAPPRQPISKNPLCASTLSGT